MKTKKFRKRMQGTLAVMAAAVLTVASLTGCNGKAEDKDEQGRTVISVGNWPQTEGMLLEAKKTQKATFEEQYPDAVIQPDSWTFDLKTFYSKAAGGQLPTVFSVGFTEMPQIMAAGYAADLTEKLKERGFEGKFNEQVLNMVSQDGKIYAYPGSAYALGLAYNVDLFEAAGLMEPDGTPKQPKDWVELAEFAKKIKDATGQPGVVFPTSNNNGGWIFTSLAWSYGVDFMEQDENGKWKATFNTPEAAEALQYIKDLRWKYDVLPSNTLIDGTTASQTFGSGGAAMIIASGTLPNQVTKYGMQPEQFGMMAVPAGPKGQISLLGGTVYCVAANATEDQIDAAIRWLEISANNYQLTDEFKKTLEDGIEADLADNELVGIKVMSIWQKNTESVMYRHKLIDEKANANPNHFRLYNEFIWDNEFDGEGGATIRPEEPMCAQELYGVLDGCIQEVLINENADCAALLEKANSDFQSNYLDALDYDA